MTEVSILAPFGATSIQSSPPGHRLAIRIGHDERTQTSISRLRRPALCSVELRHVVYILARYRMTPTLLSSFRMPGVFPVPFSVLQSMA